MAFGNSKAKVTKDLYGNSYIKNRPKQPSRGMIKGSAANQKKKEQAVRSAYRTAMKKKGLWT